MSKPIKPAAPQGSAPSTPSLQIPADVLAKAYGLTRSQIRLCLHYMYRDESNCLVKSYTRTTLDEPFTDTTAIDVERERLQEVERQQARLRRQILEDACVTADDTDEPDDTDDDWDGTLAVDV